MIRSKLTDPIDFAQIMRTHLNNLVISELIIVHVEISVLVVWPACAADIVHVELFEDLGDDEIENGNDVRRVVLDLTIKHLIKLEHMVTVDLEDITVELADFLEFLDVVWGFLILLIVIFIIIILDLLKVVDEVFEFHLDLRGIDIRTPEHHSVRAHFPAGPHTSLQKLLALIVHHTSGGRLVVGQLDLVIGALGIENWLVEESINVKETSLFLEVGHEGRCMQDSVNKQKRDVKELNGSLRLR